MKLLSLPGLWLLAISTCNAAVLDFTWNATAMGDEGLGKFSEVLQAGTGDDCVR